MLALCSETNDAELNQVHYAASVNACIQRSFQLIW